jgi:hypothetical protein
MFGSYLYRRSPVALVPQASVHHAVAGGGLTGWQIALIGVGVPLAAAVVTILLRRARARRPSSPAG